MIDVHVSLTPGVSDELWRFWHLPFFGAVRDEHRLVLKLQSCIKRENKDTMVNKESNYA